MPVVRDLLLFFLPFKAFLSESLREASLPLWNPWTFLGTPFLASLQTGVLYPPSALLLLPFPLGFNVFLLFHYLVALAGAWFLFRSRGLGLAASSLGSITYVLGGYLVSLLNVTNHLQSAAWAPLLLCLWLRHLEAPSARVRAGVVAVLSVQILGGSPETVLMTLAVLAVCGAFHRLPDVKAAGRAGLELAALGALAAALTAVQLVPTAELTRHSVRGSAFGFDQMSFWSLEPVSILQLLFPHSSSLVTPGEVHSVGQILESQVPWLSSLYIGLVPLCLVVAGLARGRERWLWATLAIVGVLLALGKHGPLLAPLYDLAPGVFGKFRYPEKFWFVVHLAAAVLCAEGAERVAQGDRQARRIAAIAAASFIVIALSILALRWSRPEALLQLVAWLRGVYLPLIAYTPLATDLVFKAQRLVFILVALLAALLMERTGLIRSRIASFLLVALGAADLVGAHYDLNLSISWSRLLSRKPLVDVSALRDRHLRVLNYQTVSSPRWGAQEIGIDGLEEGFTVLRNTDDVEAYALAEWPSLPGNAGIFHRVGTTFGGEAIDRAEIEMLRDVLAVVPRDRAVRLVGLYSVGALVGSSPLELPPLRYVGGNQSHFAYSVRDPLPRAYLASRLIAADSPIAAFNALIAEEFQPGRDAVVERIPRDWQNGPADGSAGEVTIVRYENDLVVLRARARRPALLVLNDSWFPGWEARIDSQPLEILRANALVRGVLVPPGEHEVRFDYRPLSFRVGAGISIVTGIISIAWIVARSRRRGGRPSR